MLGYSNTNRSIIFFKSIQLLSILTYLHTYQTGELVISLQTLQVQACTVNI